MICEAFVTYWNEAAACWADAMWRSSWQGGILALLVAFVCLVWKRMPSAVRYILWWTVCLKMLVGLIPAFVTLPILPAESHSGFLAGEPRSQALASPLQASTDNPAQVGGAVVSPPGPLLTPVAWIMLGWMIITAVLTSASFISLIRIRRLVRHASLLSDPAAISIANEAAAVVGLRAIPRILVSDQDCGVLTIGAWRPLVLLSCHTLSTCSGAEIRLILAHEFEHIRCGDAWLGLAPHLTQILFWFHPLVWLACREVNLARESACDERTIIGLNSTPELYGKLLLKLVSQRTSWLSLCAPGVSSHFRILNRRLSMLHQIQRSNGPVRSRFVLVAAVLGLMFAAPWSLVHAQDRTTRLPAATAGDQSISGTMGADSASKKIESSVVTQGSKLSGTIRSYSSKVFTRGSVKTTVSTAKTGLISSPAGVKTIRAASKRPATMTIVSKSVPGPVNVASNFTAESAISKPETRFIYLKYADATDVARTLTALFEADVRKSVKIIADARTNAVILQAVPEKVMEISVVVDRLDDRASAASKTKSLEVMHLKYAMAADLSRTLTTLFVDKSGSDVRIAVEDRTNSIVVHAPLEKIDDIRAVVERLDVQKQQ